MKNYYVKEWENFEKEEEISLQDLFFKKLTENFQIGKFEFDTISSYGKKSAHKIQSSFDIILNNDKEVLVIEIHNHFRLKYLHDFVKNKLHNIKQFFPEYKDYKIYGAIAGMTIEKSAKDEAEKFGFFILTQNNQNIQLLNSEDFEPNVIK